MLYPSSSDAIDEPSVRVFRLDGSLQCGMGKARALGEDRQALEQLGAKVIGEEKRVVPTAIIAVCGAPTGAANTFVISAADWSKILRSFVGPAGFALWDPAATHSVYVYRYDGSVQCGGGEPISLEVMGKELTDAGVKIISQRKGNDGLMHPFVCGAVTGAINVYEIDSADLQKARDRNFSMLQASGPTPPSLTFSASAMHLQAVDSWPLPWQQARTRVAQSKECAQVISCGRKTVGRKNNRSDATQEKSRVSTGGERRQQLKVLLSGADDMKNALLDVQALKLLLRKPFACGSQLRDVALRILQFVKYST
ncbi:hypothetical protein QA641_39385 [Bradyrhizobium sp. CB1650]|uniref:hypothetical protein n=1 Tax=Bradyrhizobium sp. CB1650 TaxID=3039153 RepID=UPI002435D133|nr:hypothetical protein [Bradyrhizobium sp. CB1650]WGD51448.1 hypothetical protein QA641_39385 [Bradyrhizobium sp. CB1650]